jgi:hypothetical protein
MSFSMEFITHGGFEMVRDTWQFIANIMNSPGYQGAIATVFAGTALFSIASGTLRSFAQTPSGVFAALVAGLIFYGSFFQTGFGSWSLDGQIAVYDDVKNQNEIVQNLPPGLVAMAGALNSAQVKLEDLIQSTILGPYQDSSEAVIGMKFMQHAAEGVLLNIMSSMLPEEFFRSVESYIKDVVSSVAMADPQCHQALKRSTDIVTSWSVCAKYHVFNVA